MGTFASKDTTTCLLLTRVKNLPPNSLEKAVYLEAEDNNWPGLGKEVREICMKIGINDINTNTVKKHEIVKALNNFIKRKCSKTLKNLLNSVI